MDGVRGVVVGIGHGVTAGDGVGDKRNEHQKEVGCGGG